LRPRSGFGFLERLAANESRLGAAESLRCGKRLVLARIIAPMAERDKGPAAW